MAFSQRYVKPGKWDSPWNWSSPLPFQCVWYVGGRTQEYGWTANVYGITYARDIPYDKTSDPHQGDIIVWSGAPNGKGHVAVIEEVNGRSVTFSEGWYTWTRQLPDGTYEYVYNGNIDDEYPYFKWDRRTLSDYTNSWDGHIFQGFQSWPGGSGGGGGSEGGGGEDPGPQRHEATSGWQWSSSPPRGNWVSGSPQSRTVYRYFDYNTNSWSDLTTTKPT